MHYYKIHNLTVACQIKLPNLIQIPKHKHPDIQIFCKKVPKCLKNTIKNGPGYQISKNELLVNIKNIASYYCINGKKLFIEKCKSADDKDVRLFLLCSIMGGMLLWQGKFPLHATTVSKGDHALLLCGEQGAGKSTLAAALLLNGYKIVADDISVIDIDQEGKAVVYPYSPFIKLWFNSINLLQLNEYNSIPIRKNLKKYHIDFSKNFLQKTIPVKNIIDIHFDEKYRIFIKQLKGKEKIAALMHNIYRKEYVAIMEEQAKYLQHCFSFAPHLNFYKLSHHKKTFDIDFLIEQVKLLDDGKLKEEYYEYINN